MEEITYSSFEEPVQLYARTPIDKETKQKAMQKIGRLIAEYRKGVTGLSQIEFSQKYKVTQSKVTFAETGRSINAQKDIIRILIEEYGARESDFSIIQTKEGGISTDVQSMPREEYVSILLESNQLLREKNSSLQAILNGVQQNVLLLLQQYSGKLNNEFEKELLKIIS